MGGCDIGRVAAGLMVHSPLHDAGHAAVQQRVGVVGVLRQHVGALHSD